MRKLIIFLYFVFLFKIAFAQSLPSLPSMMGEEPTEKMQVVANTQLAAGTVPELKKDENEANLPADFDLPVASGKTDATPTIVDNSNGDVPVEVAAPAAPTLDAPVATAAPALPDVPKIDMPTTAKTDTPEPVIIKDTPKDTSDNNRSQFPATPALNFSEKTAPTPAATAAAAPSPEQREKDVDNLLNQVFDQQKTKEQLAKEKAEADAEAKAAKDAKNVKQDDSPLSQTVINVDEKPVEAIDEIKGTEQQDLADLATDKKDKSGKTVKSAKAGKSDGVLAETTAIPTTTFSSTSYSEGQLSDLLVKAATEGNKQTVVQLLNSGRSPDSKNEYGETPLMVAIYNNQNDIIDLLLTAKANPNIADNKGNSALMVAAARGNNLAAVKLMKAGATIDQANNIGDTPLLVSSLNGNIGLVKLLVAQHASLNKTNADGLTPLHIAAYTGNAELVKYLLTAGANPNLVARGGYKPYDLAKDKSPVAAEMLLAYAAPKPVAPAATSTATITQAAPAQFMATPTVTSTPITPLAPAVTPSYVQPTFVQKPQPVKAERIAAAPAQVVTPTAPVTNLQVANAVAPAPVAPAYIPAPTVTATKTIEITKLAEPVKNAEAKKPASLQHDTKTWTKLAPEKTEVAAAKPVEAPAPAPTAPVPAPRIPAPVAQAAPIPAPVQVAPIAAPAPAQIAKVENTVPEIKASNKAPTQPQKQLAVIPAAEIVTTTKETVVPANNNYAQNTIPTEVLAPAAKTNQMVRVRYDNNGKRIDMTNTAPSYTPVAPVTQQPAPTPVELATPSAPTLNAPIYAPTQPQDKMAVSSSAPTEMSTATSTISKAANEDNTIKYERSISADQAESYASEVKAAPAPAITKQDAVKAKPASFSFDEKVKAATPPKPIKTQTTSALEPIKQPVFTAPALTVAPVAAATPITVPTVALPANLNIPKYAALEPSKQAVWDMKLEEWVRNGNNIDAQPQPQKIFWMKQQKVLQAVYQDQFDKKVAEAKQKVASGAFNNNPAAQANGITVQSRPVKLSAEALKGFKTSSASGSYENVSSVISK